MPLHLDLSLYQAEVEVKASPKREQSDVTQQIASYSSAILNGIGHGIVDVVAMVRDFAVYPILDAHVMLALATHPDLGEIDAIMQQHPDIYQGVHERMESRANTLYQISLLALDTGILWAKHDSQNPDVQDFQTLISVHPEVCHAAESRMHQRAENWRGVYQQFMQSSGQDKVELISEVATAFLGPGALLKSLDIVSVGVRNLRDFGMFFHPPKFSAVNSHLFSIPQFKLLTGDEIRKTSGMLDCIWVLTKENQLLIAPAELSKGFQPAQLGFVKEPLHPHYLTRMVRCDWVYASGEAMFSEGKLIGLFNDTTSFKPAGEHLENFVARAFAKNGFGKDYKMQGFDKLEYSAGKPFLTVSLQTPGIVSAAHQLLNHEVKSLNHECERFLKFLEKLDMGSHVSSCSAKSHFSLDTQVSNGSVPTAFQEEFKRHFRGMAESLVPPQEESSVNIPIRTPERLLSSLSPSRQHGLSSYEQQMQKATTPAARLEFSTPTQWHSGKETLPREIGAAFFPSHEKASSALSFTSRKSVDGTGYLAGQSSLSSHSVFSSTFQQAQKTVDSFQNICREMKDRTAGMKK